VASRDSSTRSVARATSSARLRRRLRLSAVPIRWRLAGGSALLTLIILCGFAAIVGMLTARQIESDFNDELRNAADDLAQRIVLSYVPDPEGVRYRGPDLDDYASAENGVIRVVWLDGTAIRATEGAPDLGAPRPETVDTGGYRVESRLLPVRPIAGGRAVLQYARPRSAMAETVARVRFFLILGVLGGSALALLAGLATARRAMAPIARLTAASREVQRTRDAGRRLPMPEADDEVAELARTLEEMLASLDASQRETAAMLARQREFVADASHELRTPLTSVLANLEVLADHLEGEEGETAEAALRSSRRMRRLVADLLLLARADAGRPAESGTADLGDIVAEAAAELGPVAGDHELLVSCEPSPVEGVRDELFRLVLNLMENAMRHTPPGTVVRASAERRGVDVLVVVEDDGPGVPEHIAPRVFERFVRGSSDHGGSSGLGLAIVRAVAERHGGTVRLDRPAHGGARFVVTLPAAPGGGAGTDGDRARPERGPVGATG
jgi:two-component system, OmpR family, sensor kinase